MEFLDINSHSLESHVLILKPVDADVKTRVLKLDQKDRIVNKYDDWGDVKTL